MIRSVAYFGISFSRVGSAARSVAIMGQRLFLRSSGARRAASLHDRVLPGRVGDIGSGVHRHGDWSASYLSWRHWLIFLRLGVLNCLLPFTLLLWSQSRIGSGLVAVLVAGTPLFTALVAHFLSADEKLTRSRLAGVLLGFAGVAVAMGPVALHEPLDWPAFAGAGLIITGLATLDGRVTRSIVRTFI
jgi:drug/metabolite transporter (DMT)-like permease